MSLTKKNSHTKIRCLLLVRRLTREINLTWLSTLSRRKWTTLSLNTKWLASLVTTWVFNLLTKMMSFVFFMRRVISKKIFWRMENKKSDKKKRKLEWSILSLKRDKDNLKLLRNKFHTFLNLLKKSSVSKDNLMTKKRKLIFYQLNLKIQRSIQKRES